LIYYLVEKLINQNTLLAKVMVGLCVGDEEVVKLPLEEKTLRVFDIQPG